MIAHHRSRPTRARADERGAITAIVALALVGVIIMTAIVVDLGFTRAGAGFNQSAVDLAALAGGDELATGDYEDACEEIIDYVNANAKGMPAITASTFCADFDETVCDEKSLAQATPTITKGKYTVQLRFPVPNSEIVDSRFGAGLNDGVPCERITVKITSKEPSFFGGVMGKKSYNVTRQATVRGGGTKTRLVPSLWLLDPVGCPVLTVQGGSKVIAGDMSNPQKPIPGVITLDSDASAGTCSTTNTSLVTGGSGTEVKAIPLIGEEGAAGEISLRGMPMDAVSCTNTKACNPADVNVRVFPQPRPALERATRAPVDWAWNCKSSYPTYFGIAIQPCPNTDVHGPYIDNLKASVGTTGNPASYLKWRDVYGCSPSGNITLQGNWWIDCPGGLQLTNGANLTFTGGNVILDNGVKINNGASFNMNTNNNNTALPSSCVPPNTGLPCIIHSSVRASFLYIRGGDLELGGGAFNAKNTMVYLANDSEVKGTGGSPPAWTAPTEGPFAGLALWAESPASFTISGGAGVSLRGTFFTPFANDLTLTGGGNWGQQNAQFISYRLTVSGGSQLTMAPDPSSAVILPPAAAILIR